MAEYPKIITAENVTPYDVVGRWVFEPRDAQQREVAARVDGLPEPLAGMARRMLAAPDDPDLWPSYAELVAD